MCNRYEIWRISRLYDEMGNWVGQPPDPPDRPIQVAPSVGAPIIRAVDGGNEDAIARWGNMVKGYATFNARAYTIDSLRTYKHLFRSTRCIIPATAWFEYQDTAGRKPGEKKPMWRISLDHGQDFALAGLWGTFKEEGGTVDRFTMIMTDANQKIAKVHDRMPIVLEPKDYRFWLDRGIDDVPALKALLVPAADKRIVLERIR